MVPPGFIPEDLPENTPGYIFAYENKEKNIRIEVSEITIMKALALDESPAATFEYGDQFRYSWLDRDNIPMIKNDYNELSYILEWVEENQVHYVKGLNQLDTYLIEIEIKYPMDDKE